MRGFALSFLLGTWLLQRVPFLPDPCIGLAGIAALLALALTRRSAPRGLLLLVAGIALGFGWAAWRAESRLADELPFEWEGRDVEVVGLVADLPQPKERGTRFVFDLERVIAPADARVPERVSLTWFPERGAAQSPRLVPGERWQLTVRLKRVRGLSNPHAFELEPWALERGIRATGYVRPKGIAQRLDERVDAWPYTLHRWRSDIRDAMRTRLAGEPYAGVLVALAIGDQDSIPPAQWDTFWRTGVGHLMRITSSIKPVLMEG